MEDLLETKIDQTMPHLEKVQIIVQIMLMEDMLTLVEEQDGTEENPDTMAQVAEEVVIFP